MITPHQGRSQPTWRYSMKYCIRPDGHQLARPRASSGGSPTHWTTESDDSGSGVGFSGKKSRTISSLAAADDDDKTPESTLVGRAARNPEFLIYREILKKYFDVKMINLATNQNMIGNKLLLFITLTSSL